MKKFFILALVAVMVIAFVPVTVGANDLPLRVVINNEQVQFDGQQPIQIDGRTLIPARGVFEQLGFDVTWNGSYRQVEIRNSELLIEVGIDSHVIVITTLPYMFMNTERIDVPAQIINSSTMIPLRAVAQAIGAEVNWNGDTRTVYITTEETVPVFGQFATEQPQVDKDVQDWLDEGYTLEEAARIIERLIHDEINALRAENGLGPREWSEELSIASRRHSEDLALNNNGRATHTGTDGSRPNERARNAGWNNGVSEIVAGGGNIDSKGPVGRWSLSSGHRANMLGVYNANAIPVGGVGIFIYRVNGGPYVFVATALFSGH